jgi:DNA-nicking Smr family endonuclease
MRKLSAEEQALWNRVVETVRPLRPVAMPVAEPVERKTQSPKGQSQRRGTVPVPTAPPARKPGPGTTLDGSWDKRLARGIVAPDASLDLHGHNLDTAWTALDRALERSIQRGDRLLLLVTGKPPSEAKGKRGAIRAAVDDWLHVSRHAGDIAAVRGAHPRHGGAGALYIILRRRPALQVPP